LAPCTPKADGVKADPEQAYLWSSLAARQSEKDAQKRLAELASRLSADQLENAQRSARDWKPVLSAVK
jgi:TPR repeat protein